LNLSHAQTENHIDRNNGVLDGAHAEHMQAVKCVKDHIDEVSQMKDVVSLTITKRLIEMSKVRTPLSLLMTHQLCIAAPLVTGDCAAQS